MDKISSMKNNIQLVDDFLRENNYLNICLKDCVNCCRDYFYASYTEFYLTLDALLKLPVNLDYFYYKAKVAYDFFNKYLPTEIKRLDPFTSNRLITNVVEDFSFGENINYQNLPDCVMLNSKSCTIYNSRPNTCRLYGTTNTCELLNNPDYTYDEYTNYYLYPLTENLQLIHSQGFKIKTYYYPLWFYFYYFNSKKFRPYLIKNLNKLKSESPDTFINNILTKRNF